MVHLAHGECVDRPRCRANDIGALARDDGDALSLSPYPTFEPQLVQASDCLYRMRQSMAKGTRRELRRAFGPEVLDTVEAQGVTIEHMAKLLHVLRADVSAIARDHALLKKDHAGLIKSLHDDTSVNTSVLKRGLLGRLRWLATGR